MQPNLKLSSKKQSLRWTFESFTPFIKKSINTLRKQNRLISDKSYWWYFIHRWNKDEAIAITNFINGSYQFEPIKTCFTKEESVIVWTYVDRLFVKALLFLIKPLFKHIISPRCLHLRGPSGVKDALNLTKKAFNHGSFRYFMRIDIKSYYASIDRKILTKQTKSYFQDPRVLHYLDQIINIPIIEHGSIFIPRLGIHRRSSMSPFLGALYLSPLDRTFENLQGVWYLRYMDDILILTKTKKQFCNAKRKLRQILSNLKLRCSRRKTKMGPLAEGFHFLGINFKVNLESSAKEVPVMDIAAQTQCSQSHVNITLHERCCVRAMDRITVMEEDVVHPMKVQRYLSKWATWWSRTASDISRRECLKRWALRAQIRRPELTWLAFGLLRPLRVNWAELILLH